MKKLFLLVSLMLFAFNCQAYTQNFNEKNQELSIASPAKSLKIGEELVYSAQWLGIPGGHIILTVKEILEINGKKCYHIVGRALPNKFFATFYDIEYEVHSYIEIDSFRPLKFIKKRRLRDLFNTTTIEFDWKKMEAAFKSEGSDKGLDISPLREQIQKEIPLSNKISNHTQDLLSSIYYFRQQEIKPEDNLPVDIYYGQRNWPIEVKIGKPFLLDIRKQGSFPAFKASVNSIITDFILGKRKFIIYFSCDQKRTPLEFQVGTAIGSIRCRLKNPKEE